MARGVDEERIRELFVELGSVTIKPMFSGAGIYFNGVIFAIAVDGIVYLKADEASAQRFKAEGLSPFSYTAKGKRRTAMSYWQIADRLYDDPDELAQWAREAIAAADRAAVRKTSGAKRKKKR